MNKAWNLLRRVSVISWLCCFPTLAFSQPNVVLVLLDNFGWGEPGFNGGGIVRGAPTPRLDQLAKEGLRLTNFNVEVQCTPSRSAFMTGRYAIRSGTTKAPVGKGPYGLVGWEYTLAEMFSDSGYATGKATSKRWRRHLMRCNAITFLESIISCLIQRSAKAEPYLTPGSPKRA